MYCIIDVETSGRFPWTHDIIELGMIVADKDFKIKKERVYRMAPDNPQTWDMEAQEIHGITLEEAVDAPPTKEVLEKFVKSLFKLSNYGDFNFICHAMPFGRINLFDRNFVFAEMFEHGLRADYYKLFPEEKIDSTIKSRRKDAMSLYQIKDQKLSTWAEKLGIDNTNHHEALHDCRVTLEILKYQESVKESWKI